MFNSYTQNIDPNTMDEVTDIVIGKDEHANDIDNNWRGVQHLPRYTNYPPVLPISFKNLKQKKHLQSKQLFSIREHSKYCPGDHCCKVLPTTQFGRNANMQDNLDTYCIDCNIRKRKEREEKRTMISMGLYSIDKYEQFRINEEHHSSGGFLDMIKATPRAPYVLKRDVFREIDNVLVEARMKHKYVIPFTPKDVYDSIFTGKMMCGVTQSPMTPACFMAHHSINVVVNENVIDIKCNKCSTK